MTTFNWNSLLLNEQQIQGIALESLEHAAESVNGKLFTMAHGVSSIGNLLACTASNGDTGLSDDAATGLGWMLESLGELMTALINVEGSMNDELSRRAAAQAVKAPPTKGK